MDVTGHRGGADLYLCQAPGGLVGRGSRCAHRFSPKPRHRFSVGLKGCRQQHLSPKLFIKKNNNRNVITKGNRLVLTIDVPGITS